MTYKEKFEIAAQMEQLGLSSTDILNVQNAMFMRDDELLQSSLSMYCKMIEELGYNVNVKDLKILHNISYQFEG